jgi:hypothetical protein
MVIEAGDAAPRVPTLPTRTVMSTREDRVRLAGDVLRFAGELLS